MKYLPVVIILVSLGGCSSMLLGNSSSGSGELGADDRSTVQISADNALTATIRSRYAADTALGAAELKVRSVNYNVTVSGTVSAFADRDRAVRIARNTDGVRTVDNQISVNTRQ